MNNDKSDLGEEAGKVDDSLRTGLSVESETGEGDDSFCLVRCRNYAYVVENAPVSVVITDKNGLIEFVNPKFEEVTGYRSAEILGKNPGVIKSGEMPPEDYSELWQTILSGESWTGEFHNRRKSGELFWEKAIISGIADEGGEISHFIGIKVDITEVKEARQKLEQERVKLMQTSKMAEIGIMASGILHEVGNPIAAIRGIICDIKETCNASKESVSLNKMVSRQLDEVLAEVDRITGITLDISEFSYSRNAPRELLDINGIISTTCRLVQYDRRWSKIDLRLVLDDQLPPVVAIKDQMIQILMNLLNNAAYAVEAVSERDSVVHVSTFFNEENAYICIKDNGCGIDPADLPRVFDPFYSSKGPGEGSGLGLALCRSFIEEQEGDIGLFSEFGEHTEVCVTLPLHNTDE